MKAGMFLALVFSAFASLPATAQVYRPVSITPPPPPREFRGAWIATVANKDWPSARGLPVEQQKAELVALLDTAVRLNLNAVVFQVRPACDALYSSPIEPWSEYLTGVQGRPPEPFYDPLLFAIKEAHKRGLELHAWFNPFRVRSLQAVSAAAPNHVSRAHPEWVRKYGGQLWLDPGEPAAREYVSSVVMHVVRRYDVDGVQFDDYFYPYPVSLGKGAEAPFPDDVTWKNFGVQSGLSRGDWRRQNISGFIQTIYQRIKTAKPQVKFGISPFGIWRPGYPPRIRGFDADAELFADSRQWLANGWLDYISPQLYWPIDSPGQSFTVLLNWWASQNVKGRGLWPGLDASAVGVKFSPQEIARQIEATRAQPGAGGEIFFHLRDFQQNAALAAAVAAEYPGPAPAAARSPARAMRAPGLSLDSWTFRWSMNGSERAAKWVLQYCGPDNAWRTEILPADRTTRTFAFSPPQIISLRAVDRAGNLSVATAYRLEGRPPAGGGSAWSEEAK